jgi:hypothetical protein
MKPDWMIVDKVEYNNWLKHAKNIHTNYRFFSLYPDHILELEEIGINIDK